METATFAGGCFWCMEDAFRKIDGVSEVVSGYTGGIVENPTYEQVCEGDTGHYEAVQVTFDPTKTTYEKLLEFFWTQIDPTDDGGQFADRGSQYMTAIFYRNDEQKKLAEDSIKKTSEKFDKPIATKLLKFEKFYPAEDYHQEYSKKNPSHYSAYKEGSGRACYIKNRGGNHG